MRGMWQKKWGLHPWPRGQGCGLGLHLLPRLARTARL